LTGRKGSGVIRAVEKELFGWDKEGGGFPSSKKKWGKKKGAFSFLGNAFSRKGGDRGGVEIWGKGTCLFSEKVRRKIYMKKGGSSQRSQEGGETFIQKRNSRRGSERKWKVVVQKRGGRKGECKIPGEGVSFPRIHSSKREGKKKEGDPSAENTAKEERGKKKKKFDTSRGKTTSLSKKGKNGQQIRQLRGKPRGGIVAKGRIFSGGGF